MVNEGNSKVNLRTRIIRGGMTMLCGKNFENMDIEAFRSPS